MSSFNNQAEAFVKLHAPRHVAANARNYTARMWIADATYNSLGGVQYLRPSEGTVVAQDGDFTLVKTGRNSFDVILSKLLGTPVNIDDKVALAYYQLRRFDGSKADGSEDHAIGYIRSFALTGASSIFPVKWEGRYLGINDRFENQYTAIQNPYLRDMIQQIERLGLGDGSDRKVVNVLIDAGASDLTFVDPPEDQSCDTPPAMKMRFAHAKFAGGEAGELRIEYDRGMDTYTVVKVAAGLVEQIKDVHFPELPAVIKDALDDGSWSKVQVTVLKKAPVKRQKREAEAA